MALILSLISIGISLLTLYLGYKEYKDQNDATQSFFNAHGAATMQDMMNGAYNPEILKERLDKIVKSFDKLSKGY